MLNRKRCKNQNLIFAFTIILLAFLLFFKYSINHKLNDIDHKLIDLKHKLIDIKHKLNDINPPPNNKLNACILVLVRKSDLDQLIKLIQNVDLVFNNKFNYPYVIFNDEEYKVYNLEKKGQWYNSWFGVIILKEDKPIYVVFLYERSGSDFDESRGILTLRGLEETVTIFFDDGEIKRTKN